MLTFTTCCNRQNSAMLLKWQVITLDHDKYERELNNIPQSHSKSIQARDNMKLRPVKTEVTESDLKARLPKLYRALEDNPGKIVWLQVPLCGRPVLHNI